MWKWLHCKRITKRLQWIGSSHSIKRIPMSVRSFLLGMLRLHFYSQQHVNYRHLLLKNVTTSNAGEEHALAQMINVVS